MRYRIVVKLAGTSQYEYFADSFPAAQILVGLLVEQCVVDSVELWEGSKLWKQA